MERTGPRSGWKKSSLNSASLTIRGQGLVLGPSPGPPEAPHTYDLFEDGAAHARHADAERNLVAEASAELHHLQLAQTVGALQGHQQQRADP